MCLQVFDLTQKKCFIFSIQVTWIVSDSEGERREKGEMAEDGLAVFDLAVGDNEKVIKMMLNCMMVGMIYI